VSPLAPHTRADTSAGLKSVDDVRLLASTRSKSRPAFALGYTRNSRATVPLPPNAEVPVALAGAAAAIAG
jgi:hypothetical protein